MSIKPNMQADKLVRVNVSKTNVVDPLDQDPLGALSENIMIFIILREITGPHTWLPKD